MRLCFNQCAQFQRICNPITNCISYLYIHFTTSTIFSPKACWIRAMALQVKLWPPPSQRVTSDGRRWVSSAYGKSW